MAHQTGGKFTKLLTGITGLTMGEHESWPAEAAGSSTKHLDPTESESGSLTMKTALTGVL